MFLTEEDPRAAIKGSRDPLGLQVIWIDFARKLISNLTTQSVSVRGFTILCLGKYLAEKLVRERGADAKDAVEIFLRIEQISAYVRFNRFPKESVFDLRGITRVSKNSLESKTFYISPQSKHAILSDQQAYGLLGLYSVPARISGLIPGEGIGVNGSTREFIDEVYWSEIAPYQNAVFDLAEKDGYLRVNKPDKVCQVFEACLKPIFRPREREFYKKYLQNCEGYATGDPSVNIQRELAELMLEHWKLQQQITGKEVRLIAEHSSTQLKSHLDAVIRLEAVLSVLATIFDHVLSRDGDTVDAIATNLKTRWELRIPNIEPDRNEDLMEKMNTLIVPDLIHHFDHCQRALVNAQFEEVIESLINWAKIVAENRGGSPWVTMTGKKLNVKYRRPERRLPTFDELQNLWRHSYFFSPLNSIAHQLAQQPEN